MFEWLPGRIAVVLCTAAARDKGWQFFLNPPADAGEVARCEAALGLSLPASYRAFVSQWDGVSLFRQEHLLPDGRVTISGGLTIAGTEQLPALNSQLRADIPSDEVLPEEWGQLIICCTLEATGNYCALNPEHNNGGEYAIVDCFHESRPRCWRRAIIEPSFEAWLERLFAAALADGDPYYWLNLPEIMATYDACAEEMQREAAGRRARSRG